MAIDPLGESNESTEKTVVDSREKRIWYRESLSSLKAGPFSLAQSSQWYEHQKILPSAEFSIDDGSNWISIVELRHKNGPFNPFLEIGGGGRLIGSVANARQMVSSLRSEVDGLEGEMASILKELTEEERMLKKLRELEKILDPDSFTDSLQNEQQFEGSNTQEYSVGTYGKAKIMSVSGTNQSSPFRPLFFCPQAFRLCARAEVSQLHSSRRIGPHRKVTRDRVMLDGPLAILTRCNNLAKRVTGGPRAALAILSKFHHPTCRWLPFFRATSSVYLQLRCDFDTFDHPSASCFPVYCELCRVPITSARTLIDHVTSIDHTEKVVELGTSIDEGAFNFWNDAIDRGFLRRISPSL